MYKHHLGALDFNIMVGDVMVHVESMSASISDGRTVVYQRGVPNGFVDGDVKCDGDIEVDSANFKLLVDVARASGSWREIPPADILAQAKNQDSEQKVELFGCVLNIADLFNVDGKGGEKTKHKIKFEVSGTDFVRIDGVPYLSNYNIRDL
ncbi:MAG: phage protein [Methylobacter sp.]